MGACCGKGSAPKDDEKTPYSPVARQEDDEGVTVKDKPVAVSASRIKDNDNKSKTPAEVPASKRTPPGDHHPQLPSDTTPGATPNAIPSAAKKVDAPSLANTPEEIQQSETLLKDDVFMKTPDRKSDYDLDPDKIIAEIRAKTYREANEKPPTSPRSGSQRSSIPVSPKSTASTPKTSQSTTSPKPSPKPSPVSETIPVSSVSVQSSMVSVKTSVSSSSKTEPGSDSVYFSTTTSPLASPENDTMALLSTLEPLKQTEAEHMSTRLVSGESVSIVKTTTTAVTTGAKINGSGPDTFIKTPSPTTKKVTALPSLTEKVSKPSSLQLEAKLDQVPSPTRSPTASVSSTTTRVTSQKAAVRTSSSSISPNESRSSAILEGLSSTSPVTDNKLSPASTKLPSPTQQNAGDGVKVKVSEAERNGAAKATALRAPVVTKTPAVPAVDATTTTTQKPHTKLNHAVTPTKSIQNNVMLPIKTQSEEATSNLKTLLPNLEPSVDAIIRQHNLCDNTRAKFLNAIDAWLNGTSEDDAKGDAGNAESPANIMALVGKPGAGKSCLAAELTRRYSTQLAGYHFFSRQGAHIDHNNPRVILLSLCRRLCDVLPGYVKAIPTPDKFTTLLRRRPPFAQLCKVLISNPFNSPLVQPSPVEGNAQRMLLVLDDIDQCSPDDARSLLQLVTCIGDETPAWLRLVVTSTDDNALLTQLRHVQCLEMKHSADNQSDIKRFLRNALSPHMDRISLDGGLTAFAKKTKGNFLCARLFCARIRRIPDATKIAISEIDNLFPTGLSEFLVSVFEKVRKICSKESSYDAIIGAFVYARAPLNRNFIQRMCPEVDTDALLDQLSDVLAPVEDNVVSLVHTSIGNWLRSADLAQDCAVNTPIAHARLAEACLQWLSGVVSEGDAEPVEPALEAYALRHAITHLTDSAKQQAAVTRLLTSLTFMQAKLSLEDITTSHVLADYRHRHWPLGGDKPVTLDTYLKRQSLVQIENYAQFARDKSDELSSVAKDGWLVHLAADYISDPVVNAAARRHLSNVAWLEQLAAPACTPHIKRAIDGGVNAADVSSDGRTLALLCTDDEGVVSLHLLETTRGERRIPPVDVTTLKDRAGSLVRFMPDNANVFVGSLSTYVNVKGRPVPSGNEVPALQNGYTLDCCDVSARHFISGISTIPAGGRSLNLLVIDQRTKRCLRMLELLLFRFGGSAQCGVRACAVSDDARLVCSCVKQSPRDQLTVVVWSMNDWSALHTCQLNCDSLCHTMFLSPTTLLINAGGVRGPYTGAKMQTWKFTTDAAPVSEDEMPALFHSRSDGGAMIAQWSGETVQLRVWKDREIKSSPSAAYRVQGLLSDSICMAAVGESNADVIFVRDNEVRLYKTSDMVIPSSGSEDKLSELIVRAVCFLPRSDAALLVHENGGAAAVSVLDVASDRVSLTATSLSAQVITGETGDKHRFFRGGNHLISCSADGNYVVLQCENTFKVWDRSSDDVIVIPEGEDGAVVIAVASPKDGSVAVVREKATRVCLYDLKTQRLLRKACIHEGGDPCITDVTFIPSSGHLLAFHDSGMLAIWSGANGQQLSAEMANSTYARVSPASDRILLNSKDVTSPLLLRNCDGRFRSRLRAPDNWLSNESDVDFVSDGTTIVGVCAASGVCRIWNAGNGEVLNDLDVSFDGRSAEIVGMLTNTHAAFCGRKLLVADVASGATVAYLPSEELLSNMQGRGVRVSPRGNVIIGITKTARLSVIRCHNFVAAKRSTTLQRMKSFAKS